MATFLGAHGYDPGPSQRPLLAGAISGLAATVPALTLLHFSGALAVEARILGLSVLATVAAGEVVMAAAGAVYARVFGRAANDASAGWLSGMAYGFALWGAGAVMILPLASGGRAPAGSAAIGVFLSLVLWGAALGALLPWLHRPLQKDIETASKRRKMGPAAALMRHAAHRPSPPS
jgi:hypothetical protein